MPAGRASLSQGLGYHSRESRLNISNSENDNSHPPQADWSFNFTENETTGNIARPTASIDAMEFAKATLHQQLAGLDRTSRHLQSLIRGSSAEGMSSADIAVFAGVAEETVDRVIAGTPLLELLFARL